jgi:hypothetical protein
VKITECMSQKRISTNEIFLLDAQDILFSQYLGSNQLILDPIPCTKVFV